MKKRLICLTLLLVASSLPQLFAQQSEQKPCMMVIKRPDLTIRQFQFAPTNDKVVRVNVVNIGGAQAAASVLRLTVRKIKGTAVGRTTEIQVPAIQGSGSDWVLVDAKDILPVDVSLKDTTFRLNVDVTDAVKESNEKNNETWHNLN